MKDFRYIKVIIDEIDQLSITDKEIKEELIDHYCSFYEQYSGSESEKLIHTINTIKQLDMRTFYLNHKKRNRLTKVVLVGLFLGIFISSYSYKRNFATDSMTEFYDCIHGEDLLIEHFDEPPYGSPLKVMHVTSHYGNRVHPYKKIQKFHHGIDLKAPLGTLIYAVEDGVIVDCGFHKKRGFFIDLKHDDIYTTRYFHMQEIEVKKGQKIYKEDVLGKVGSSGLSLAPHLHYEIIKSGASVDPIDFLKV